MLTDAEWDISNETIIGNPEVTIALQELKTAILRRYNVDFCRGVIIDKLWLQKVIKTTFMRPKEEINFVIPLHTIYVSDFSTWWLENHADEWKVSAKKKMEEPAKNQYKKFVETLTDYEAVIREKLQMRSLAKKDIFGFIDWLETENYQISTIERTIGRLRFFLNRATEMDYEVSQAFKERIYFKPDGDIEGIYLNETEIKKIIDKDFSYDNELNVIKQNFLISLHCGLRISDFMRLDISNIKDGNFTITSKKTKIKTVVPVHPVVDKIIKDNFGFFPRKVSSSEYNKQIKVICQVCEIDSLVYGKLFDKDLRRKKNGYFKKYLLISSHIARKSFLTNNYDKVSPETINSILGWTENSNMAKKYNKTSKVEYANKLKEKWSQ
jgi:integrase